MSAVSYRPPHSWLVPLEPVRQEIQVANSRFIASLAPAASVEIARAHIQAIRGEFPDATHHVPAFIIGGGNTRTEFCSDDGEPAGTSGRPLLTVLKGSGFGNIVAVVTRYFGGTLLGTGGLVKAYTDAGKAVLEACRPGRIEAVCLALLAIPYHSLVRVRQLVASQAGVIDEESFGDDITLTLAIPGNNWESFQTGLAELSSGALQAEILDHQERIVPV